MYVSFSLRCSSNNNHEVCSKFWFCCKLCFITDLINWFVVAVWWSCDLNQLEQVAGCRLIETALSSCISNLGWQAWKRSTRHHAQYPPIRCQDEKRWKIDLFTNAKLGTRAAPQKPLEQSSLPIDLLNGIWRLLPAPAFDLHSSFECILNWF